MSARLAEPDMISDCPVPQPPAPLSFPTRIVLELTPRCNLICPMCPRQHLDLGEGNMPSDLFTKLIQEIVQENREAVILPFWRGESCLHPDFVPLMDIALNAGLRVHLSTNGHFMPPDFQQTFYRCEFVTFSIHTKRGYEHALQLAAKKPSWSRTAIQVSFVQSEPTARDVLPACLSSPTLNGFDSVRLYVDHSQDGQFGKSSRPPAMPRQFCPKLTHTFVVGAEGRFSRCNHVWQTEQEPTLHEKGIKDIWNGPALHHIRHSYPDPQCSTCDQWTGHTTGETWRKTKHGSIEHHVFGTTTS